MRGEVVGGGGWVSGEGGRRKGVLWVEGGRGEGGWGPIFTNFGKKKTKKQKRRKQRKWVNAKKVTNESLRSMTVFA